MTKRENELLAELSRLREALEQHDAEYIALARRCDERSAEIYGLRLQRCWAEIECHDAHQRRIRDEHDAAEANEAESATVRELDIARDLASDLEEHLRDHVGGLWESL